MTAQFLLIAALVLQGVHQPLRPNILRARFRTLDNVEGSWINLNHVPIRPLVVDADNAIYAVNTHDSTVEKFVSPAETPVAVWGVPWNPVSIALWSGDVDAQAGPDELLVVTRGTYGLTRLDRATGQILRTLELPAEPGDILVDEAHQRAFVSCSGADCVVQIDLPSNVVTRTYTAKNPSYASFHIEHPLFMAFDPNGKVVVAPLLSGNNSTAKRRGGFRGAAFEVLDLANVAVASPGLPDEDLFLIDPDDGPNGSVEPVVKGSGTILFAHGFHPLTHDHWQLNTEALNQHKPARVQVRLTEADHRGVFSKDRISISKPKAGSITGPLSPPIDLDGFGAATPDPDRAVGQPYALAFHPTNGKAFVTGLLSDNVVVLDSDGSFSSEWNLPDGSNIPRAAVLDTTGTVLLVYSWGTNEILAYRWSTQNLLRTFRLRHDPTPANVQAGRALLYDASHSLSKNVSCATCHVEGRSDMLAWTLSDIPRDDKGPLLTQTLAGIEKMRPFHWRGERMHLKDFNGAFDALLGGNALTDAEFADFEAFVFSIQNPANPNENNLRMLDPTIKAPSIDTISSDAIAGQNAYFDIPSVGGFSCNRCHQLPTGTNNDMAATEAVDPFPKRTKFKVAPFHELWRRADQKRVNPGIVGETPLQQTRALLGAGTSHAGLAADLAQFVQLGFGLPTQTKSDITSFVFQIDQGLAPAVHRSFFMDAASAASTGVQLAGYLLPQAQARNCGCAAITCVITGPLQGTTVRWMWRGGALPFVSDHPSFGDRNVAAFQNAATSATDAERTVFFGLPVGMSERFAVDYDFDQLRNGMDAAPYVPSTSTTGTPAITLAPVAVWANPSLGIPGASTKTARVRFETDRPTTATVKYTTLVNGAPVSQQTSLSVFSKVHAPVLAELIPSTSANNSDTGGQSFLYDLEITLTDRGGHQSAPLNYNGVFRSADYLFDSTPGATQGGGGGRSVIVGDLTAALDSTSSPGNGIVTATVTTHFKQGGPPADPASNFAVVASVLVNGVKSTTFVPGTDTFKFSAVELRVENPPALPAIQPLEAAVEGDFVTGFVTGSRGALPGQTTFEFTVPGYVAGTRIKLNIEAIVEVTEDRIPTYHDWLENPPSNPTTLSIWPRAMPRGFSDWSFPDTLAEFRAITVP